ncbi:MAG: nuclear transport factor 2 family protein [Acidobacteriota bacterium]
MSTTGRVDVGDQNKATVREFFQRLEQEDIEGFLGLFSEDGRQINPYASGLFPEGADGLDALRAYWEPVPGRFDGMRFPIDEIHTMGDPTFVFVRYRGEITLKDGAGVYANDYYSTFRFDDRGKITEYVEIFNPIVAARGFGLLDRLTESAHPRDRPGSDETTIANTLARYFTAVDDGDWTSLERLMSNPFHLDYSSFGAGDPADLEPAVVLDGWKQVLPGFDHTHHQIGNLEIELGGGDEAEATCYVTATHQLGERVWTVVGTYDITLRHDGSDWAVSGLRFGFKYQTGDTDLPADAQERVALTR